MPAPFTERAELDPYLTRPGLRSIARPFAPWSLQIPKKMSPR
jgi:hypothetical protein